MDQSRNSQARVSPKHRQGFRDRGEIGATDAAIKGFWNAFALQPKARAMIAGRIAFENIGSILHWAGDDIGKIYTAIDVAAKGDMAQARAIGAHFLDNPEMYTAPLSLRASASTLTTRPRRTRLRRTHAARSLIWRQPSRPMPGRLPSGSWMATAGWGARY